MKSLPFSILISIYKKERPEYLRCSLESVINQSCPSNEIIIVEDGPLTPELYFILDEFSDKYPIIKRIKLEKNHGLGYALSVGLKHCSYDYVARMDTDDVCKPNRFEIQIQYLIKHPDIDVLGSWIDEFYETTDNVVSQRKVPENNKDLFIFGKTRNPMNHPTVIFKKKSVLNAGSYQTCMLLEDYFLWARMLNNGYKFHNIQKSLLFFRLSHDIYNRRGGIAYAKTEVAFQYKLYKMGYLSYFEMMKNILSRFFIRISPVIVRKQIYTHVLR